jgi:DNA-binding response OmpR family regulator
MRPRILSVSYDQSLLRTRQLLLEAQSYDVVSCASFEESLELSRQHNFDLFVLGHSIPTADKQRLIDNFRRYCAAPVISLRRYAGDEFISGADYHVEPEPESLLRLIHEALRGKSHARGSGAQTQ